MTPPTSTAAGRAFQAMLDLLRDADDTVAEIDHTEDRPGQDLLSEALYPRFRDYKVGIGDHAPPCPPKQSTPVPFVLLNRPAGQRGGRLS